jgi:citrate synthase
MRASIDAIKIDQFDQRKIMTEWLRTDEALERLGVRSQTLYAYVSRGRVHAEADPADPRRSRYRASDIAALRFRKARGRKAADVAESAISWGEPVLSSAITTVADGRLYYRGRDAARLAETETLEGVARLLRGGAGWPLRRRLRPAVVPAATMRERVFAALARRAATAAAARDMAALDLAVEAASLPDILADAVVGEVGGGPIHERLAHAWACGPKGIDLVRRALVLLADHELNASTFAARVAASTGASLAASALAGLATLSGPLHGGAVAEVSRLAEEAAGAGGEEAVAARLAHGVTAPGFGHPLYPDGDPRARALLGAFAAPPPLEALRVAVETATGQRDNLDFALLALAQALHLPDDAPFALFAVARSAGWVAHAMEQIAEGALIRPRARYAGPLPEG